MKACISIYCRTLIFFCAVFASHVAVADEQTLNQSNTLEVDLVSDTNFISGFPATRQNNLINVVIEIPAGSTQKWEVEKSSGRLERERLSDGSWREIHYLGYPANYGMIPRTLMSSEAGGDGDPLDVILLGPAQKRGDVVAGRVIGVLELQDNGEKDDKLIAVIPETAFEDIHDIRDLRTAMPGVLVIFKTWFTNYKGKGVLQSKGFQGSIAGNDLILEGMEAYRKATKD